MPRILGHHLLVRSEFVKTLVAIVLLLTVLASGTVAQGEQSSPPPPTLPPMPSVPPGIGPQPGAPNNMPGAAGMPAMPPVPGAPPGGGARMPGMNEPAIPQPTQHVPIPAPTSTSSSVIAVLDSTTPFVQAFDFVLMVLAGLFCWRARKAPGLTILAISCFVSAIILLGFFLFGIFHGQGAFPQTAYIIARLLAPFELLLFAIAIIVVARSKPRATD